MDAQTTLQALAQRNFTEKKILAYLKKCRKKLSFNAPSDLWNLSALARWLYVYGYDALALRACKIIDKVVFAEDFDIWTPIETLLLLELRLYREQKKAERVKQVKAKILAPMRPHPDAFKRRLSFNWLNDKSIARYLANNDLKTANQIRFADLSDLLFIRELGQGKKDIDGKSVAVAKAEQRIVEYKEILRQGP